MRRILAILSVIMLFLVSGCVTIHSEVKINENQSGKWVATVIGEGTGALSRQDITNSIDKTGIKDYKLVPLDAQQKEIQDKEVKSSNAWKFEVNFKDAKELNGLAQVITDSKPIQNIMPLEENSNIMKVNLGTSKGTTTITIDGNIIEETINTGILKDTHTVSFGKGEKIEFQYKKLTFIEKYGVYFGIISAVVALVVGYIVWRKKRLQE